MCRQEGRDARENTKIARKQKHRHAVQNCAKETLHHVELKRGLVTKRLCSYK